MTRHTSRGLAPTYHRTRVPRWEYQGGCRLPAEVRGNINNLCCHEDPGVPGCRRAGPHGEGRTELSTLTAGAELRQRRGAVRGTVVHGATWSQHAREGRGLGWTNTVLAGQRQNPLCARPKAAGRASQEEGRGPGARNSVPRASLESLVSKMGPWGDACIFHRQAGGSGDETEGQSCCCDFRRKSV